MISNSFNFDVALEEKHLWEVGNGRLYDVEFKVIYEDKVKDKVKSYFGFRNVSLKDGAFMVNGEVIFG